MPLDAVCLKALVKEMSSDLENARIDKVQQPARDLILLTLYTKSGNKKLLISAGAGSARFNFTNTKFENPDSAPMFCMLLRKHLVGGRILRVYQPNYERIAIIDLISRDELGVERNRSIVIELMGRSSNLMLVDEENRIIDCLRRIDFGETAHRRLLPGMIYRLPEVQEKPLIYTSTKEIRKSLLEDINYAENLDKGLMSKFSGMSPLVAREITSRANDAEDLELSIEAFLESVEAEEFTPTLLVQNSVPKDFSFMKIRQYGDKMENVEMGTFSDLLDKFYAERDHAEQLKKLSLDVYKSTKTLRDRQARKLVRQKEELSQSVDREKLRHRAELITANMWQLKKGDRKLQCEDYYQENSPLIEIELDPLKTPQQNAAVLFKEYKKAVTAEEYLLKLIDEGETKLYYLESVLDALSRCESTKEIGNIRREMTEAGFLKNKAKVNKNGKAKKEKYSFDVLRFRTSAGFEVLVGRSNTQNDELTFKMARRTDLWFHTQKVHGSHVIMHCEGLEPDKKSIEEACILAATFSQASGGGKTVVDYTQARYVKKPSGSLPGMVIYTNYESAVVEADKSLAERLK